MLFIGPERHLAPPSKASTCQKIVALMLENFSPNATSLGPFVRGRGCSFKESGDTAPISFGQNAGRGFGLMPHIKPSNRDVAHPIPSFAGLNTCVQAHRL